MTKRYSSVTKGTIEAALRAVFESQRADRGDLWTFFHVYHPTAALDWPATATWSEPKFPRMRISQRGSTIREKPTGRPGTRIPFSIAQRCSGLSLGAAQIALLPRVADVVGVGAFFDQFFGRHRAEGDDHPVVYIRDHALVPNIWGSSATDGRSRRSARRPRDATASGRDRRFGCLPCHGKTSSAECCWDAARPRSWHLFAE